MKVCLIQTDPQFAPENLKAVSQIIQNSDADLYLLPELFTTGFDKAAQTLPPPAEPFPAGSTYQHISCLLQRRESVVVCGLLEQYGSAYYNVAAVIGNGWADRYWQKYPAFTSRGSVLPIHAGDYRKISFSPQWSLGMMVCNDHYRGNEFFAEYKKRGAQAVVLIADSSDRTWLERFPDYCREYDLTAMICNAAGPNGGGSCILSSAGEFLPLRTSNAEYKYLPDKALVGFATI